MSRCLDEPNALSTCHPRASFPRRLAAFFCFLTPIIPVRLAGLLAPVSPRVRCVGLITGPTARYYLFAARWSTWQRLPKSRVCIIDFGLRCYDGDEKRQ